jgi:hypothetical protein
LLHVLSLLIYLIHSPVHIIYIPVSPQPRFYKYAF